LVAKRIEEVSKCRYTHSIHSDSKNGKTNRDPNRRIQNKPDVAKRPKRRAPDVGKIDYQTNIMSELRHPPTPKEREKGIVKEERNSGTRENKISPRAKIKSRIYVDME
jgi:hypothetical protein